MLAAGSVHAEVDIETVTVGDPGNAGEWSGESYGGPPDIPDSICGAVDYVYNIGKFEITAGEDEDTDSLIEALQRTVWDRWLRCSVTVLTTSCSNWL